MLDIKRHCRCLRKKGLHGTTWWENKASVLIRHCRRVGSNHMHDMAREFKIKHSERQIQFDNSNAGAAMVKLNLVLKCKQSALWCWKMILWPLLLNGDVGCNPEEMGASLYLHRSCWIVEANKPRTNNKKNKNNKIKIRCKVIEIRLIRLFVTNL